jgi:threonine/homoserine/homoserine lactone efflux protein
MEQFLIIAAAHFLAVLSPGPDFFLITRTSVTSGWRVASGACVGVAAANAVFIALALTGTSGLNRNSTLFLCLQLAGCAYLLYLGIAFLRYAGTTSLAAASVKAPMPRAGFMIGAWQRAAAMGFASGMLNPKNALFYVSLAAMLSGPLASAGGKTMLGIWMFSVVLLWDVLVAVMIGNQAVLQRFSHGLPWLERISGAVLILLALGILVALWIGPSMV